MKMSAGIPWEKFGLISELASRLKNGTSQFGKTKLQKLVYLMQEAYGLDCGYSFSLYTYGPFCSELTEDLDSAEAVGGVVIGSSPVGYSISPGPGIDKILDKAQDFLKGEKTAQTMQQLIEDFGTFSARDLELRSTLIFVSRDDQNHADKKKVLELVHEIKPKFSMEDIESAAKELETKGFINF